MSFDFAYTFLAPAVIAIRNSILCDNFKRNFTAQYTAATLHYMELTTGESALSIHLYQ